MFFFDARIVSSYLFCKVAYLKNYINVQMQRFEDNVTIVFNYPALLNTWYIQPLLLERSIMYLSDNYKDKIMTYMGHYENEIN
jgi:LytS/YehU family sensor histidine kinase